MSKPLAIIIKDNVSRATRLGMLLNIMMFYADLKLLLEVLGYEVEFDDGTSMTCPRQDAAVWVGHSRGIDRLQYSHGPKTVALVTMSPLREYLANNDKATAFDLDAADPLHYVLSPTDLRALLALSLV